MLELGLVGALRTVLSARSDREFTRTDFPAEFVSKHFGLCHSVYFIL